MRPMVQAETERRQIPPRLHLRVVVCCYPVFCEANATEMFATVPAFLSAARARALRSFSRSGDRAMLSSQVRLTATTVTSGTVGLDERRCALILSYSVIFTSESRIGSACCCFPRGMACVARTDEQSSHMSSSKRSYGWA